MELWQVNMDHNGKVNELRRCKFTKEENDTEFNEKVQFV